MDPSLQIGFETAKLLVAVVSAFFVAWYWNSTKDHFERYQYLDESYNAILKMYFEYPQFGKLESTDDSASAFKEPESLRYHYFAMRVHTFLETLFDLSKESKGEIPDEWLYIYRYHRRLHSAWLKDHPDLQEPAYVKQLFA